MASTTLERPAAGEGPLAVERAAMPVVATRSSVRLTARGRLVLLALVSLLAVALIAAGAASVSAATATGPVGPTATVVVQPGQTLWEVAEKVAPDRDPRDVVRRIADRNALTSSVVAPGQALVIPAF